MKEDYLDFQRSRAVPRFAAFEYLQTKRGHQLRHSHAKFSISPIACSVPELLPYALKMTKPPFFTLTMNIYLELMRMADNHSSVILD